MLQSLLSLTDDDVNAVTDAVRQWCAFRRVDIDSQDGRRAITAAIELIQTRGKAETLLIELTQQLQDGDEGTALKGRRILVAEDDFLLADELADALRARGADVIGPCCSEEDAMAIIHSSLPTDAIVDINLGRGASFRISRVLAGRGIPFFFMTGYDQDIIPAEFAAIPFYRKPIDLEYMVGMLSVPQTTGDRACAS